MAATLCRNRFHSGSSASLERGRRGDLYAASGATILDVASGAVVSAGAPLALRRPELEFSPDGGILAFETIGGVALHDLLAGTTSVVGCRALEGNYSSGPPLFAGAAAFSPAGDQVLCAPTDFSQSALVAIQIKTGAARLFAVKTVNWPDWVRWNDDGGPLGVSAYTQTDMLLTNYATGAQARLPDHGFLRDWSRGDGALAETDVECLAQDASCTCPSWLARYWAVDLRTTRAALIATGEWTPGDASAASFSNDGKSLAYVFGSAVYVRSVP